MKKRLIGIAIVVILFLILIFFPTKKLSTEEMNNLIVKSSILYSDSLLKTDALSQQANSDYEEWIIYINKLTEQRETVYKLTKELETQADKLVNVSRGQVTAYDAQEITSIIDKAPPWKKIKTLAKELNISAEKAFKLLKMSQEQLTAEARNQAGDTFEKLENTAKMIKDWCKVWLMIWWWQIAWAASTLDKVGMLINWADLVLQIGEDVSNIALGYNNQVATVLWDIRKITEPGAAIVWFAWLYNAWDSAINMINAFTYTFEATNDIIQEWKVMWIKLDKKKSEMTILDTSEIDTRTQDNNILTTTDKNKIMEEISQLAKTIQEQEQTITQKEEVVETKKIEEKKDKNEESIIGQRTHTQWNITSTYTFTENELSLSATSNWEKLGNTITMKYKYEDGKGYRWEPNTPSYITFELKNNTLYTTNIYKQKREWTKTNSTIENNNTEEEIDNNEEENITKSLAWTKWEIIDWNTHWFMEFTDSNMIAWALVNWQKMWNTVTMPYTYKDWEWHYWSDDPKAVQRVDINFKWDKLILKTKNWQTYEYYNVWK